MMRRNKKKSFTELMNENKQELLQDAEAIREIEERLDNKHYQRLKQNLG